MQIIRGRDKKREAQANVNRTKRQSLKTKKLQLKKARKQWTTKQYTPRGGLSLAIRRSCSNASARGLGFSLLCSTHHSTIAAWEIKAGAAMIASSREFCKNVCQDAVAHACADEPGWKFLINQYRSDATRGHVWQDSAIHCTEIQSLYTSVAVTQSCKFEDVLDQSISK